MGNGWCPEQSNWTEYDSSHSCKFENISSFTIEYPSHDLASVVQQAVFVDEEIRPDRVSRVVSVKDSAIHV